MERRLNFRFILAILMALGGAFTYFTSRSTNPITGESQHVSLTPQQEIAIGLQSAPGMARQFGGELPSEPILRYVNQVGQKVVAQSDAARGPYPFRFHVLSDPKTINAFALPGGQIFITLGLLRRLSNEAQLAGVLSHEIGHVVGRHSAEQMAKQQFSRTLAGAAGVASYDPDRPGSSMAKAAAAQAVAAMVNMKYGREDELESDSLGVRFMKSAGYDPSGLMQLMKVLQQAGGGRTPEFFSTHPNPGNRLEKIQALIQQSGGAGGETGEDRFQANVLAHIPESVQARPRESQ